MKKLAAMFIALFTLSFLPFAANAGHWVVRCHKPCHKCVKVCHKKWVRGGHYHRHHHHHHCHHCHHGW